MSFHRAIRDASLDLVIESATPLRYGEGEDPAIDRPAHVRAGSGLVVLGDIAWVVQDDALFLAWVHLPTMAVRSVALPAPAGTRLFGEDRGNKKEKPDFEVLFALPDQLVALGSGSTPKRRRILLARRDGSDARILDAEPFYKGLEARTDFRGSELNLEGAVLLDAKRVRLFNRGNGAATKLLQPIDATADVALGDLLEGRAGDIANVRQYDLGKIGEVKLTFTDATAGSSGEIRYLASAEDSPDTYSDGVVTGSAIGAIAPDGSARFGHLLEADRTPSRRKLEGLAWDAGRSRWLAVEDKDDPEKPCEIVVLRAKT